MLAEAIVLIPKSANKGTEIQMDVLPLVLCKDCKFGEPWGVLIGCGATKGFGIAHKPDWFCADGVAKDINVPNNKEEGEVE